MRGMPLCLAALACLGVLTLASCDQELVLVTDVEDHSLSTKSFRAHVGETGGFGLVTVNAPTTPSKTEVDNLLASKITVTGAYHVKITPAEDRVDMNRIVLVFNPPLARGRMNPDRICSGKIGPIAAQPEAGALRIYGVVCASDRVVSHAMTLSYDIAPGDPRFAEVAKALSLALFPIKPYGDRSDCNFC